MTKLETDRVLVGAVVESLTQLPFAAGEVINF